MREGSNTMEATMIFNHYKNILDELIDEVDFFKNYFQNPFSLEEDIYGEEWTNVEALYTNTTNICFGATRGCIIDNSYDYVVKFDLDESEYGNCDDEIRIYNIAKERDLEKFFLRPRFIGVYERKIHYYNFSDIFDRLDCNYFYEDFPLDVKERLKDCDCIKEEILIKIPLYAYPRAERYEYPNVDKQIQDSYIKTYSNSPLAERSSLVAFTIEKEYGKDETYRLSDFLYDLGINDLHTGNLMCYHGKPCFSDYCGYNG